MPDPPPVELWELGVPCPVCGETVLVEVAAWADGAHTTDCPADCDCGHAFTASELSTLTRRAAELLDVEREPGGR